MKKLLFSAILTLAATSALAQDFVGEFKNWGVFTTTQDGKKVCYMTSVPVQKAGNFRRRGEPYVLVTYRGNGVSEVSVNSGFPYKDSTEVDLKILNKASYKLFTSAQTPQMAWAKDSTTDNAIVENMKKGATVTVRGTSKIGTYAQDTYRLTGFTAAFDKMKEICK